MDARRVLLTPQLKADIADQLSRVKPWSGRWVSSARGYSFISVGHIKGKRIRDFDRRWRRVRREVGCAGMFKHDLRRTAAKEMVRLGVSEKVIMQIGGWKTPSMFDR